MLGPQDLPTRDLSSSTRIIHVMFVDSTKNCCLLAKLQSITCESSSAHNYVKQVESNRGCDHFSILRMVLPKPADQENPMDRQARRSRASPLTSALEANPLARARNTIRRPPKTAMTREPFLRET